MSSRNKAILAVLASGLLTFWLGWSSKGVSVSALAAVILAGVMAGSLACVGVWLSDMASRGEFSERIRLLLEHLEALRLEGDYSKRLKLTGDDLAARISEQIDGMIEAVLRRLSDAAQEKAALIQESKAKEADLEALRLRLTEETQMRLRSEEGLRQAIADFEARVKERTEELSKSNGLLVEEVSQRTLAESALRQLHLELEQRVEDRTFELALANEMLVKEIEDRKQAEGERQKFVSLVESANDFIALATLEGEISFLNDAGRRLLGLDASGQLPPIRVCDIEGASSRGTFREIVLRAVVAQGSWEGELELRGDPKTGRRITADVSANLLRRSLDGKPLCIALVLRDITDRRQAEAALKDLEERFSTAFHASPAGIAIVRIQDGRFIDLNRSLLQSLGYAHDEIIGKTMADLGLWQSSERYARLVEQLELHRTARDFKCRWVSKSGEVRDLQIAAEPMELSRESCLLIVAEDITERLRLEDQLRQAQKMEAVGQLAAGIAHDFNNILTVVQGHASLLLSDGSLANKSSESARCVSTAADRAAKLTRQLLTFSRKQVVQWKELDLNRVVQNLASMLRSLITENVSLSFHYLDELPSIRGDANMLEQVLLNLVVNARDAMPKGGSIVIDTSVQTLDAEAAKKNPRAKAGRFVCLTVMDTGTGMDAATLERIFEPFFSTKEFGQGTGLGLATVYGVVTQHNGWIDVTSGVGHGSLFRVYFPALTAPPPPKTEPTSDKPGELRGGKETVLVVEDELGLRMLVEAVLQKYGYTVILAEHGVEALKLWKERQGAVDLLLTDMVMPEGMTGLDLSEQLRVDRPDLRIIYMSGYSVDFMGNEMSGVQEGFNFLQKPYRPDQLVRAVREVLDSQAQPLPRRRAVLPPTDQAEAA